VPVSKSAVFGNLPDRLELKTSDALKAYLVSTGNSRGSIEPDRLRDRFLYGRQLGEAAVPEAFLRADKPRKLPVVLSETKS